MAGDASPPMAPHIRFVQNLRPLEGRANGKDPRSDPEFSPVVLQGYLPMNAHKDMDLATGQVAWDLVIQHHYPLQIVAERLRRTPEELCDLLLAVLVPNRSMRMH